jgi:hypothetical protein
LILGILIVLFFAGTIGGAQAAPAAHTESPRPVPYAYGKFAHVTPVPTPAPGKLSVSTRIRSYSFAQFNAAGSAANPNRHAFELGAEPHLDYHVAGTPLDIGYTYFGATGFGLNGPDPISNPRIDNSLPGFPLDSPLHEIYLSYEDEHARVSAGNRELNYAWTPASDSRIMPASYQGIDVTLKAGKSISLGLTRIIRFEQRNSSNFEANTLVTAAYPGTTPQHLQPFTPGALRAGIDYHPVARFDLLAENYVFYTIADLVYAEWRYGINPYSRTNPYLALQYVAENSLAPNAAGIIGNQTYGAQLGATLVRNLLVTASADIAPWKYAYVNAPSASAAAAPFFTGTGGTGAVQALGRNRYKVAYGGIASPYTATLGTDPLYTAVTTLGMADRSSAGNSYKAALVYTSSNKQLRLAVENAWWQYSNDISRNLTAAFAFDGTYYLNPVRPGPYRGLLVKVKLEPVAQPTLPYNYGKQRFMLEYDV